MAKDEVTMDQYQRTRKQLEDLIEQHHNPTDEMQQGNISPFFLMKLEVSTVEIFKQWCTEAMALFKEKGINYYWKQVEKI